MSLEDQIAAIEKHRIDPTECKHDRSFNEGLDWAIYALRQLAEDEALRDSLRAARVARERTENAPKHPAPAPKR